MTLQKSHYEEILADCSDHLGAIALLKQHRSYLEMLPSMRRSSESVITIPLPLIRVRQPPSSGVGVSTGEMMRLPCDVAILMCDPEWKIKTGAEIFVFIHRPDEDFSDLLSRWRQTQMHLDKGYEWMMPDRHRHILSEGSDEIHPLFVLFADTPHRIQRGLSGASLPFVMQASSESDSEENSFGWADTLPSKEKDTLPSKEKDALLSEDTLSSEIFGLDESWRESKD